MVARSLLLAAAAAAVGFFFFLRLSLSLSFSVHYIYVRFSRDERSQGLVIYVARASAYTDYAALYVYINIDRLLA